MSVDEGIASLLTSRKGHFLLESGHHGDLWLDLELLCIHPEQVRLLAAKLATQLSAYDIQGVCGPLVEGAFVALMVAAELGVEFSYSERIEGSRTGSLFPVAYRVPNALRGRLRGQRLAIVNDVVNAGSAVRGTFRDLQACGAETVAIGTLVVLGDRGAEFAGENGMSLERIAAFPSNVWTPSDCPLCEAAVPLDDVGGFLGLRFK